MSVRFLKPSPKEVQSYASSIGFKLDGEQFCDFYESKGWLIGKTPMKNWQAAVRTWKRRSFNNGTTRSDSNGFKPTKHAII